MEISVRDNGAGIPAHAIPRLFDRHYERRNSRVPVTSDEGKGLALAIVKRIVELHRGTAAVFSQPGPDTTVTLTVPG